MISLTLSCTIGQSRANLAQQALNGQPGTMQDYASAIYQPTATGKKRQTAPEVLSDARVNRIAGMAATIDLAMTNMNSTVTQTWQDNVDTHAAALPPPRQIYGNGNYISVDAYNSLTDPASANMVVDTPGAMNGRTHTRLDRMRNNIWRNFRYAQQMGAQHAADSVTVIGGGKKRMALAAAAYDAPKTMSIAALFSQAMRHGISLTSELLGGRAMINATGAANSTTKPTLVQWELTGKRPLYTTFGGPRQNGMTVTTLRRVLPTGRKPRTFYGEVRVTFLMLS